MCSCPLQPPPHCASALFGDPCRQPFRNGNPSCASYAPPFVPLRASWSPYLHLQPLLPRPPQAQKAKTIFVLIQIQTESRPCFDSFGQKPKSHARSTPPPASNAFRATVQAALHVLRPSGVTPFRFAPGDWTGRQGVLTVPFPAAEGDINVCYSHDGSARPTPR